MENTVNEVEAVAVFKTHERLQGAVSIFKCNAVVFEMSTSLECSGRSPAEFYGTPGKSILKKTKCDDGLTATPEKRVAFNDVPEFNFIERVLINWEKFAKNQIKKLNNVKKIHYLRLPCAQRYARLAVLNNVVLPIGRATKRKAEATLQQPGKRRKICDFEEI